MSGIGSEPTRDPIYEIRLKGQLDPRWFHRFEGMQITYHQGSGETLLIGPVIDQSALFGMLAQIQRIGIPLLTVRRLPDV